MDSFRESHHLIYHYSDVTLSESVLDLITRVRESMAASPMNFKFHVQETVYTVEHETQDLQLLELVQRGIPRRKDGHIRLRRPNINITRSLTVRDLLDAKGPLKQKFAMPLFHVENQHFVIYLRKLLFTSDCSKL